MPTTITASQSATATQAFNQRHLDRNQDGTLWSLYVGQPSFSLRLTVSYSKDNGATWAGQANVTAAGQNVGAANASLFIDVDDYAHVVWKDSGTSGLTSTLIYYMRGTPNAGRTAWTWSAPTELSNGAGAFDYPDVVAFRDPAVSGAWQLAVVMSGLTAGPANQALYRRHAISSAGTLGAAQVDGLNTAFGGPGIGTLGGSYGVNSHTYPSIDFNHTGDGKTVAGGTPHLYVGWTAGQSSAGKGVRFRKAVYSGGSWTWNAEREIDATRAWTALSAPYHTWHTTHFDGTRVSIVGQLWASGVGSVDLVIYDRDAADAATTTTVLFAGGGSPTTNSLASGSSAYDSSGNIYLLGNDATGANGTRKLNVRKWTRVGASLGAITTFDTSGSDTPYISAKRGYSGAGIDWVYTDGTASPYNVTFDRISLNAAPNAPTLVSPVGNVSIDRAITQRFSWTFSDPDAGDTQSKYDLQYRIVGAGSWTTVTGTTPNAFHDFVGGTFAAGSYEWQVRTYDAAGAVGPYSSSGFFTAAATPAVPTITSPVNNATISANSFLVTWSAPSQDSYQVRTVADNAGSPNTAVVYTDTGEVVSASDRSRTVAFATNNRTEHVQVRVKDDGLWSSWASVKVNVSFTPPAAPTLVALGDNATASIGVIISHPAPSGGQPTVAYADLYRREGGSGNGIRIATNLAGTYTDRTPASGVVYEYQAVAVAGNGTTAASAWTG